MKFLQFLMIVTTLSIVGCAKDAEKEKKIGGSGKNSGANQGGITPCGTWTEKPVQSSITMKIESDYINDLFSYMNDSGQEVRDLKLFYDEVLFYQYEKGVSTVIPVYDEVTRKITFPIENYRFEEGNSVAQFEVNIAYAHIGATRPHAYKHAIFFNQLIETEYVVEKDCHHVEHLIEVKSDSILGDPDGVGSSSGRGAGGGI